jgi:hypothetical protein
LDLDEREAAKLLAISDPLAGMAETNEAAFAELMAHVETESDAVRTMWDAMLAATEAPTEESDSEDNAAVPEAFQVVVECRDEAEQRTVFERLTGEGYACRLLTL